MENTTFKTTKREYAFYAILIIGVLSIVIGGSL
jgi:hypothetical protein